MPAAQAQQAESSVPGEDPELLFEDDGGTGAGGGSLLGIGVYVRMIVVLAVIVVLIYLVFRFLRSSTGDGSAKSDDTFLRRVASLGVGPGKSVQVITLVDSAYLIGVSDNAVNLISKIEDKELINAMNLYADKNDGTSRPKSFGDVLDIFTGGSRRAAAQRRENIFENKETEDILASLKDQGRRLDGEEK